MAGRIHTKRFVREMPQTRFMSGPRVHSFRFLIIKYKHISSMTFRDTSIINNYISRYNQLIFFFQKIKFIFTSYNVIGTFYAANWKEKTTYSFHEFHKMKANMSDVIHPPASYRPISNKWIDIHKIYYQDSVSCSYKHDGAQPFVFWKYLIIYSQVGRLSAYQGGMCSTSYFQFKFIPPIRFIRF